MAATRGERSKADGLEAALQSCLRTSTGRLQPFNIGDSHHVCEIRPERFGPLHI